ncbi:hypothetical protein SCHPADRAFT_39097 [Schizopora paradoxa]|uniref:Uncharacterized protein n=1 Tax=Schizopora paradoxa TaxID=27342 RepID=A0A0H2SDA8_9AGAM|nr:hypothetical protein SCHPADRAFT_39097 [Schizopora paradoxa]
MLGESYRRVSRRPWCVSYFCLAVAASSISLSSLHNRSHSPSTSKSLLNYSTPQNSRLCGFENSTYSLLTSLLPSSSDVVSTSTHRRRTPLTRYKIWFAGEVPTAITVIAIPLRQLPPCLPPTPSKSSCYFPNEGTTTLPPGSIHACTFGGTEDLHAQCDGGNEVVHEI